MNSISGAVPELPKPVKALTIDGRVDRAAREELIREVERQLQKVLADFNAVPSRQYLYEVGAVAEVAVLGRDLPSGRRLAALIGQAAADWARRGLLEEICFSESQSTYHTTILLLLAGPADWSVLRALSDVAMIGRSEWPALTQLHISLLFHQCGITTHLPGGEQADFTVRLDKRCLRARLNEYDLILLLTVAHLIQLRETGGMASQIPRGKPRLLPHLLLAQALRERNLNWLPVLAFLNRRFFGLSPALEEAARGVLREVAATPMSFGLPAGDFRDDLECFSRTARSLRIRSAAALAFYLDCCMEESK